MVRLRDLSKPLALDRPSAIEKCSGDSVHSIHDPLINPEDDRVRRIHLANVPRIHLALARPKAALLPHRLSMAQNIDETGDARFVATATDSALDVTKAVKIGHLPSLWSERWSAGNHSHLVGAWRRFRRRAKPSWVWHGVPAWPYLVFQCIIEEKVCRSRSTADVQA
jgi:hypothetical protein